MTHASLSLCVESLLAFSIRLDHVESPLRKAGAFVTDLSALVLKAGAGLSSSLSGCRVF